MMYRLLGFLRALLALCCVLALGACSDGVSTSDSTPTYSDDETNEVYYQCLLDEGVPVERDSQGIMRWGADDDDLARQYDEADKRCIDVLTQQGYLEPPETEEDTRARYGPATALHDCLVAAGHVWPDWPSEDVFVEQGGEWEAPETVVAPLDGGTECIEEFEAVM